jgi:HK97 family phage major capsid protein
VSIDTSRSTESGRKGRRRDPTVFACNHCGETRPGEFYSYRPTSCRRCHISAVLRSRDPERHPSVLDWVGKGLVRSVALKFDLGGYEGSGTPPEIRGLKNVSGISTVSMGTNGAIPTTLDHIADAIAALEAENATAGAIAMHPRSWKTLLKLKETSTANKALLQSEVGGASIYPQRTLYGVPVYLSPQISVTETQGSSGAVASSAYVYDTSQVVAVMRQDARVELDSSRLFDSDSSELRCTMRADVVVPNPKGVCRVLGILA